MVRKTKGGGGGGGREERKAQRNQRMERARGKKMLKGIRRGEKLKTH